MSNEQHQGAHAPGPLQQGADPRVHALDSDLRAVESIFASMFTGAAPLRDMFRTMQNRTSSLGLETQWTVGVVLHPIGGLGWYKVQVGGGQGSFIRCCQLSTGGFVPLGVRDTSVLPPNATVVVMRSKALSYGIIMGVLPPMHLDGTIINPDWIVQGGQSGYKREKLHKYPIQNLFNAGHVLDFSGQRPADATGFERGWISSTGMAITLDDYLLQLRVNEFCGLFMTYFDSYCRLSGLQLDIQSSVHEDRYRDDEGESHIFHGSAPYAHEALGLYDSGTDFAQWYTDQDVQLDKPRAKYDLSEEDDDLQPFYRWQTYEGYLGQGHLRMLARPPMEGGKRHYKDQEIDDGLFAESISMTGAYSLRSAKSLYIGRRVNIVVPKTLKAPEDGKGDDAEEDNYKFAGKFGGGDEHKIKDVEVEGEQKTLRRVAGVSDLISYVVNWAALHPFHYHKLDYKTPQESESTKFQRVQENLNFGSLASDYFLEDPTPVQLKIDQRYGDVDYFQRESFLYFTDDGGVVLSAGCGSSIVFDGSGQIGLNPVGDLLMMPGRSAIVSGQQVVLRALNSVDISASKKDVRIKAEKNLQILGGNGGSGGILIESKSVGRTQTYNRKIGEDVVASGIVIKATNGFCGLYGRELYLRTGGRDLGDGNITLDASQGRKPILLKGRNVDLFAARDVNFYYGPVGETSTVNKAYSFKDTQCLIDAKLLLGGQLINFNGKGGSAGLIVDGGILASSSIACGGVMADRKGMFLGKAPGIDGIVSAIAGAISDVSTAYTKIGEAEHESQFNERYYRTRQPGHDQTIADMQFSFRDVKNEKQYGVKKFKFLERRWEQMQRFGLASGGTTWEERPVQYQSEQLYPWPGRKKWQEEPAFLQLDALTMFDAGAGRSKDRPYDEPKLGDWSPTTMSSGFKVIEPN